MLIDKVKRTFTLPGYGMLQAPNLGSKYKCKKRSI